MRMDDSLHSTEDTAAHLFAMRAEMKRAAEEIIQEAEESRRRTPLGSIAAAALVGSNGSFGSFAQYAYGCAQLDDCQREIADRKRAQGLAILAYLDDAERIHDVHSGKLDGIRADGIRE